jgi:hypothetical protein
MYIDSLFTSTTCLAAKDYALNQAAMPYKLVYEYKYSNTWEIAASGMNPVTDPITGIAYDLQVYSFKRMYMYICMETHI